MLHTEKSESLGGEITRALLCNRFVQRGIEPYMNHTKQISKMLSDLYFETNTLVEYDVVEAKKLQE